MLYPAVEFFTGLIAASAGGSLAKTAAVAAPGVALALEKSDRAHLEKLDLSRARNVGMLVHELERRGLHRPDDVPDDSGIRSVLEIPVLHPKLADFAGKWALTTQEEVLLFFFLGREQVRLGVGKVAAQFADISKLTGIPKQTLMEWFFQVGQTDLPSEHFVNGELEAYLRYLKDVIVPARLELLEEQNG